MLRRASVAVIFALALGLLPRASAQNGVSTGTMLGTVTDSTGAVVPRAQVVARNGQTGYSRTVTSREDGTYELALLPPGEYTVTVSLAGFKTLVRSGLSLSADQNLRIDASLEVGQTSQSVTVAGAVVEVDTHSSELSSTVHQTQLAELPLAGNAFLQVVNTVPGVIPIGQSYGPNVNPIYNMLGTDAEAAGSRFTQSDYQIDSSEFRTQIWGGSPNEPSSHTIQEVQVIRDSFNAEYGISSGIVVNAITKSGTNKLHGSGYETGGSDKLDSQCFDCGPVKGRLHYNQFGGDIGGPVYIPHIYNGENKTFFYFNYEGTREPSTETVNGAIPPTAQEKAGNFTALSTPIIDPTTGQQFNFEGTPNVINPAREDPDATYIWNLMPLANFGNQWVKNFSTPETERQYTIKIDQQFGAKSHLFGRWYNDIPQAAMTTGTMIILPDNQFARSIHNSSLTINHAYSFSPNLINQTSVSWTRIIQQEVPLGGWGVAAFNVQAAGIQNWDTDNGLVPVPDYDVPQYNLTIQPSSGLVYREPAYLVDSSTTWIHGRHTVKFGIEYGHWNAFNASGPNNNGRGPGGFTFDGQFTGDGLADFYIGAPSLMSRASSITSNDNSKTFGVYLQDDWKVSRRLTANVGLRWGYQVQYSPEHGYGAVFIAGQQSTVIPNAPVGLNYPGDKGVPGSLFHTDYRNFSPRIGLAFDPTGNGKTSIRAGFGIYYQLDGYFNAEEAGEQQPYGINVSFTPSSLSNPFNGVPNPFPYAFNPSQATFNLPVEAYGVMTPNLTTGYVEEWDLAVQHQLGKVLFEADYKGNGGHKLISAYDINPAAYIPGNNAEGQPNSTLQNEDARRIYEPGVFSRIVDIANYADSDYNAFEFSARGRPVNNLLATFAWTWGHSLDNSSFARQYDTDAESDPYCLRCDKGNSNFDFRHLVTGSLVWNLPKFKSLPMIGRAVLGNWAVSSIFTGRSGGWAEILAGEDVSLSGVEGDRAQVLLPRSQWYTGASSQGQKLCCYANPKAFGLPAPGTFGNAGRNDLETPGGWNDDLSIMKTFPIKERAYIKFNANAYNAFNHVVIGNCHANWSCFMNNAVSDGSTFGSFYGWTSGRTIQLAVSVNY